MSDLYLSRLRLDPRQRDVQRALADCHLLHQRLMGVFPTAMTANARAEFGLLYRVDIDERSGIPTLIVQSTVSPDWTHLARLGLLGGELVPETKDVSSAYAAIAPPARLRFRLRANPTRRVHASHAPTDRLAGKRVEVRDEEGQRDWLERKGEQGGFRLGAYHVRQGDVLGKKQGGWKRGDDHTRHLTFATAVFDGVLEVADAPSFVQALRQGIGPGKAYGFGLLSVALA
jgi:CRISPR system Cascade subunit CasE